MSQMTWWCTRNVATSRTCSSVLSPRLLMVLLLGSLISCAHARGSPNGQVFVVDMLRAIQQTKAGRAAQKELKAVFLARQAELDRMQLALQARKDDLEATKTSLSQAERDRRTASYLADLGALRATYHRHQRELNEREEQLTEGIASGIERIVDRLGKSKRYANIIPLAENQVAPKHASDITHVVIKEYDTRPESHGVATDTTTRPQARRPIKSATDAILSSMRWLELPDTVNQAELSESRGLAVQTPDARRNAAQLVSTADALMSQALAEEDHERRADHLREAALTYEEVLLKFADFRGLDRVLFGLSYALELQGEHERTRAVLYRLFKEHWGSPLVPVGYFVLAEHYLAQADFARALPFYAKVCEFGAERTDLFLFATYRRALCLHAQHDVAGARTVLAQMRVVARRTLAAGDFSALDAAARDEAQIVSTREQGAERSAEFMRMIANER